jgi:hypothetical protein
MREEAAAAGYPSHFPPKPFLTCDLLAFSFGAIHPVGEKLIVEGVFAEVLRRIVLGEGEIVLSVGEEARFFVIGEGADDFCRDAESEDARRDGFAFGDDRAGADDAGCADCRAIQEDSANADQTLILDSTAVKTHSVADGDVVANDTGAVIVNVEYCSVLDICTGADCNAFDVGAKHGIEPDVCLCVDEDVSDDDCALGEKYGRVDAWFEILIRQHHEHDGAGYGIFSILPQRGKSQERKMKNVK